MLPAGVEPIFLPRRSAIVLIGEASGTTKFASAIMLARMILAGTFSTPRSRLGSVPPELAMSMEFEISARSTSASLVTVTQVGLSPSASRKWPLSMTMPRAAAAPLAQ